MSSMQRRKGHAFERLVAIMFRQYFPEARRGLSQPRSGGEVSDVDGTPFWVECKHRKRCNAREALEQAYRDAKASRSSKLPIAVTRDNGKQDIVTMTLDGFLHVAALAYANHRKNADDSTSPSDFKSADLTNKVDQLAAFLPSVPSPYQGKR